MAAVLSLLGGLVIITGIIGAVVGAVYLAWWLVLLAIHRIPMIGRRHRHGAWDRLNRQ